MIKRHICAKLHVMKYSTINAVFTVCCTLQAFQRTLLPYCKLIQCVSMDTAVPVERSTCLYCVLPGHKYASSWVDQCTSVECSCTDKEIRLTVDYRNRHEAWKLEHTKACSRSCCYGGMHSQSMLPQPSSKQIISVF